MNVADLDKKQCCGCAYCITICPKSAIHMSLDECGALIPVVNQNCVDCGLCVSKCPYNALLSLKEPIATFAACRKEQDKIMKSSSGGVFAAIAESLNLSDEWYVAGCILDDNFIPKHIVSSDIQEIEKMYGSKYVQSDIQYVYAEIKEKLKNGYKVLFSGTPCQVNAIQKFTQNNENLYTIEVICHGVTSPEMFSSYLSLYNKENIKTFVFRDKNQGWTYNNLIVYKDGKRKKINHRLSSYMTYFLNGETYRESCYSCIFAKHLRGADITLGDFWGVVRECQANPNFSAEKGVSCLLVNTKKGYDLINHASILKNEVPYESIYKGNEPLNHPSTCTHRRSDIIEVWRKNREWKDVERYFRKHDYSVVFKFWSIIPLKVQHLIRVALGKR